MRQDEPSQGVILPGGRRESALPVGGNLLQNGIPASLDSIECVEHFFRREITNLQKVVGLVEIFHDPVHLGIKRNRDSRGLSHKSKNRAVQAARDEVVGIAQHGDEVPPGPDCGEMDLSIQTVLHFIVQKPEDLGGDTFVVAER